MIAPRTLWNRGSFAIISLVLCIITSCKGPQAHDAKTEPTPPEVAQQHHEIRSDMSAERIRSTLTPFPGITVDRAKRVVAIDAEVCLDAGWLEQVACSPHTREHEAIMVVKPTASQIHASLLLAGFEPGRPGNWSFENDTFTYHEPVGSELRVRVRYRDDEGREIEHPVRDWIRDHQRVSEFPDAPFIFGGSVLVPPPEWMMEEGRETETIYAADESGSIIGLVTFGDEVIGFSSVLPDEATVSSPEWEVNTDRIPPVETSVTILISPYESDAHD